MIEGYDGYIPVPTPPEEKRPDPIPALVIHGVSANKNKEGLLVGLIQFKIMLEQELNVFVRVIHPNADSGKTRRCVHCSIDSQESGHKYMDTAFDAINAVHDRAREVSTYLEFYREDMRKVVASVFGQDLM